jgi:hypothetical protein
MTRRHELFSLRALSLLASVLAVAAFGCGAPDGETASSGDDEGERTAPSAPQRPSGRHGAIEGERPGLLAVSAVWLDADPGTTLDSSKTLTARITNTTDTERSGRLALVASGLDGRLVERPVREFRLAPRASEDVAVAVSSLPIQSETSAPFVALEVQTDRADGGVSRVSSMPLYYLFRDGYRRVTLHSAMDVLTKLGTSSLGEPLPLEGRVAQPDGTWLTVGGGAQSARGAPVQAGYGVRLVPQKESLARKPQLPRAPDPSGEELLAAPNQDTIRACVTWRVQYSDAGFGEDDFATSAWQDLPARFARAWVTRPGNPTRLFDGQLDVSGCTPALALDAGPYVLEYDTWHMTPDGLNKRFDVFNVAPDDSWNGVVISVSFNSTGSGANTTLNFNPTFNDDAVQVAAITAHALGKDFAGPVYGAAGMGIVTGGVLLANEDCPGEGGGSCIGPDGILYIGTSANGGPHASHWKYIIAHEIGHMVQQGAMGRRNFHYDDTAPGPNGNVCRCDHYGDEFGKSHCLQSREISGAAQNEGFAHAFATRLFNAWLEPNATFVYYKPVLTYGITPPPMPVNVFQDYRWMETFCPAEGRGVELDWLNFFHRVSAEFAPNNTSFADLFAIYRHACTGNTVQLCFGPSHDPEWNNLLASALAFYGGSSSNPRYLRFRDTGVAQGVDH